MTRQTEIANREFAVLTRHQLTESYIPVDYFPITTTAPYSNKWPNYIILHKLTEKVAKNM